MAAPGKRTASLDVVELVPLGSLAVEDVKVVEGNTLVVDTTVAAENEDLALVVGRSAVGPGLGSTDLAFGVFGLVA